MGVCEHCGLNIDIFEVHAPGCPLFSEEVNAGAFEEAEAANDNIKSKAWRTIIEVSAERGEALARSVVVNGITGKSIADDTVVLDDNLSQIIKVSSWSGVMGVLQVFAEQQFFDIEAIQKYLSSMPDDIM